MNWLKFGPEFYGEVTRVVDRAFAELRRAACGRGTGFRDVSRRFPVEAFELFSAEDARRHGVDSGLAHFGRDNLLVLQRTREAGPLRRLWAGR